MKYVLHTHILLAFLSIVLFTSCERKSADNSAKIKFEFAPVSSKAYGKAGEVNEMSSNFSGPAATDLSQISCYVVLVGGPDLRANTCEVNTDNGNIRNYYGIVAGGVLAGNSIEVYVPSGVDRVITLVGFRTSEAGYCPPLHNFDKSKMSDPYVLGEVGSLKLEPGATETVPVQMTLNTNKYVKDCQGPEFGTNINGGGGNLQEPDQISTYLPFGSNHITQNLCFAFPIELKKSGNMVQTSTAKTVNVNKVSNGFLFSSTFAGVLGTSGSANGTTTAANFSSPYGIVLANSGNLYIADSGNHTIRKITTAGVVSTIAGLAGTSGSTDGIGSSARFSSPAGLAVDSSEQYLYVADSSNHLIRRIDLSTNNVTNLIGNPAGTSGFVDGSGSSVRFFTPKGLAIVGSSLFVADSSNNRIRKIDLTSNAVSTFAGSGTGTSSDGVGTAASFFTPAGIAADPSGNLYVTEVYGHIIKKIDGSANVTRIAGTGAQGTTNGVALSAAEFYQPYAIAWDPHQGALLVADRNNQTIRMVSSGMVRMVTTFAGIPNSIGGTNSTAAASTFNYPSGLAVNSAGDVFISDTNNHAIRKVASNSTIADMKFYNTLLGCELSTVGDETTSYTFPVGKGRILGYFKSANPSATPELFSFDDSASNMTSSNSNSYTVQGSPSAPNLLSSTTSVINFNGYYCSEIYVYTFNSTNQTTSNATSAVVVTPSYAATTGSASITFSADCSSKDTVTNMSINTGKRYTTFGIWTNDITNSYSGTLTLTPTGGVTTPLSITISH